MVNTAKIKKVNKMSISRVPHFFWVLTAVALGAGLLSMILMLAYDNSKSNAPDRSYPIYVSIMQEHGEKQPVFYKRMRGTWYLSSGTTEMILSLYADGHFTWESVDSKLKYTRLYAAGRYANNKDGKILFSLMKELGYPFDPSNPALTTHFMELGETAFSFQIKDIIKSKYKKEKTLIIDVPQYNREDDNPISPALSSFMNVLSKDRGALLLKYIGTPILKNKRKLRKPRTQ